MVPRLVFLDELLCAALGFLFLICALLLYYLSSGVQQALTRSVVVGFLFPEHGCNIYITLAMILVRSCYLFQVTTHNFSTFVKLGQLQACCRLVDLPV